MTARRQARRCACCRSVGRLVRVDGELLCDTCREGLAAMPVLTTDSSDLPWDANDPALNPEVRQ